MESNYSTSSSSSNDIHASSLDSISAVVDNGNFETSEAAQVFDRQTGLPVDEIIIRRLNRLLEFTLKLEDRHFTVLDRVKSLEAEVLRLSSHVSNAPNEKSTSDAITTPITKNNRGRLHTEDIDTPR